MIALFSILAHEYFWEWMHHVIKSTQLWEITLRNFMQQAIENFLVKEDSYLNTWGAVRRVTF